jgi:hypothetical protein
LGGQAGTDQVEGVVEEVLAYTSLRPPQTPEQIFASVKLPADTEAAHFDIVKACICTRICTSIVVMVLNCFRRAFGGWHCWNVWRNFF